MHPINIKYALSAILFLWLSINIANSKNVETIDVDAFIRKIDLSKLINSTTVRNIIAQTKDPKGSTDDVNEFDEYIILGVNSNNDTVITKFDKDQKILQRVTYKSPWIGVADFTQKEIPNLSLEDGLRAAQSCMYDKGESISNTVSRVVIYKTLKTQQVVYDYAFFSPDLYENYCQEILYTPATKDCEMGMVVPCHQDIMYFQKKP